MISTNSNIVLSSTSPKVETVSNLQPLISKQLFWKLFRLQAPQFIIKPENKEIIYSIFRYFLQLPNFNEYGVIKNKAEPKTPNYGFHACQLYTCLVSITSLKKI